MAVRSARDAMRWLYLSFHYLPCAPPLHLQVCTVASGIGTATGSRWTTCGDGDGEAAATVASAQGTRRDASDRIVSLSLPRLTVRP
jgi:hypothetical protein